ncbi:mediator of RNA polymerase II transcription complex subunit 8-domain-containing protein [Thelonectria olida]|uniref:Mediator of RNA polymerase II transcription subunit 8 n=1 Tax=Thelonectria olida TaxID=1576542 RepID=A0A9P8W2V9_9HYPO|nr:mediator of RNA polymerase II transcription complex subunit 8-domain-containing protein [Thelonectria olida]
MASLGLDDDELKALEQTVSRFKQLSSSIQSLKMDLLKSNPLPPPSSLQASAQILQKNLQTVLDSLNENADVFSRLSIHPSTNYPGRTQEGVLTQLLRKKLEPDVEDLVTQGRETAHLATPAGIEALQDIWHELREWTNIRISSYVRDEANDPYTAEERAAGIENVRTGLRRNVEEDDDDEEDDEDEEKPPGGAMEGVSTQTGEGAEPELLLYYMTRGDFNLPSNIEFERGPVVAARARGLEGINILPGGLPQPGQFPLPGIQPATAPPS